MKQLVVAVGVLIASHAAFGMSQTELQSAIDAAESGATVEVTSDVTISSALSFAKAVTLRSAPGQTNVITRSTGVVMLSMAAADAALRIENLVFDGNAAGAKTGRFVDMTQGTLTLGAGAVVRNVNVGSGFGGFYLRENSRLVMEEGSEIRAFTGSNYAHGVHVGTQGGKDLLPVFDMKGGLITACHGTHASTATDYDGAVYVYGGTFNMSGGLITGNTSDHAVAGVCVYLGMLNMSGTATITNNVGNVNDLNACNDKSSTIKVTIADGYSGWFSLYTSYVPDPSSSENYFLHNVRPASSGLQLGLGRISSQRAPGIYADGYKADDDWIYWSRSAYRVNGVPTLSSNGELDALLEETTTVELLTNVTWQSAWELPAKVQSLTLTSAPGMTNALCVKSGFDVSLLKLDNAAGSVRLENVTLRGAGGKTKPLFHLLRGRLTLGAGSTLEKGGFGVHVNYKDAFLEMLDGAVIRDCCRENTDGNALGSAVYDGFYDLKTGESLPRFEMKGGLITNCVCITKQTAKNGYGAAVYVHNAEFEMTGGAIVGNICTNAAAGVLNWDGSVRIGGSARIEHNIGAANDLYVSDNGTSYKIFGDFRGHVGVSGGNQAEGTALRISAESDATGVWNLFANPSGGPSGLIGMTDETSPTRILWAMPAGTVGDAAVASAGDAARAMPKSLDVTAEWTPIAFSGCALAASGTVAVNFDPDELEAEGKVPLTLFSSEDGNFTGSLSFTLPETTRERWAARKRGAACVLDYRKGLALLVR